MSIPDERTEVLRGSENIRGAAMKFFADAKTRIDVCAATVARNQQEGTQDLAQAYFGAEKRGVTLRVLTEITRENVAYCKGLMKVVQFRHLDGSRGNFAITDNEYIANPGTEEFSMAGPILYSNEAAFVRNQRAVFDALWEGATPAEERISEIEQGTVPPRIEVIRDPQKVRERFVDLIGQAKDEIQRLLPTVNAFRREEKIGVVDSLWVAATERGVRVSMLTPDSLVQQSLQTINKQGELTFGRKLIEHRSIVEAPTRGTVTVLIVDRNASLIIEQKDDSQLDFAEAIGLATFSSSTSTVKANIQFFERTWEQVELEEREKVALNNEKRARRSAELLQDILSHDIRNYNQIAVTSAEVLQADQANAEEKRALLDAILKATRGSSDLIQRTKKLGSILSQADVELYPIDVERSLQTSVALIIKAHPERSINLSASVESGAQVLADDLLEEVFTNVLSNSVNYTERDEVPVEIQMEEVEAVVIDEKRRPYWKITFTDQGKGIPDKLKEKIFTRYLSSATGAGLGLSIVHALIVERYSGKVAITDRVEGDYKKGTKVEVWLPKA
ncbi:MAG: HAMP domain-containing histidine kinase [Thaumarchaeota archaeon]|nr:HAMP domain-containing histidine kinase [Nitrososphaerota archaeon]